MQQEGHLPGKGERRVATQAFVIISDSGLSVSQLAKNQGGGGAERSLHGLLVWDLIFQCWPVPTEVLREESSGSRWQLRSQGRAATGPPFSGSRRSSYSTKVPVRGPNILSLQQRFPAAGLFTLLCPHLNEKCSGRSDTFKDSHPAGALFIFFSLAELAGDRQATWWLGHRARPGALRSEKMKVTNAQCGERWAPQAAVNITLSTATPSTHAPTRGQRGTFPAGTPTGPAVCVSHPGGDSYRDASST